MFSNDFNKVVGLFCGKIISETHYCFKQNGIKMSGGDLQNISCSSVHFLSFNTVQFVFRL